MRRMVLALGIVHAQGLVHGKLNADAVMTHGAEEPDFQLGGFSASVRPRSFRSGLSSPSAAISAPAEAFPICTTMTGLGTESDWAQLDPDFAEGKRALAVENWNVAIRAFGLAVLRDPSNADIQIYTGYAHARLGQLGPAMGHYQRALMLNTRHRVARVHLGELFLMLDAPLKAREQLAALEEICLIPCEEITHLQRAIDAGTGRPSLRE